MAFKTTLEQLEAVQAAIEKVELGQSVTMSGVSLTRGDLKALYAREERLQQKYAREQGTGLTVNTGIPRRD